MKKYFTILFSILLLLLCNSRCLSQYEKANWFFGDKAGLTFNKQNGIPDPVVTGAMFAFEGSSVISDKKGNLLFYTNGLIVWDKHHNEMPNGKGLKGHFSSTQPALIVPNPANENLFYIFTITSSDADDEDYAKFGLQYSVVDVSKNEWNGDVTEKNHFLFGETIERLAGTRHANGKDFWVVVHELNTNCFLSYLVTESGVNTTPVKSFAGSRYPLFSKSLNGYMKISHDGKKIVAVNNHTTSGFDIAEFDNETGKVSNSSTYTVSDENVTFYGIEFSANSSKLYLSAPLIGKLFQYDVSQLNPDSIRASEHLVVDDYGYHIEALQIASNDKIYCASFDGTALSVVNQPNNVNCSFVKSALNLKGRRSQSGLPNFISGNIGHPVIPLKVTVQAPKLVCEGDTVKLDLISNNNLSYATVKWTGPNKFTSQSFNPLLEKIQADQSGYYEVEVINNGDTTKAGVMIEVIQKPSVSGNFLNFPNVPLGLKARDSFYVTNLRNNPVEITASMVPTPSDFHIISPPFPFTLGPKDSVKVVLEFEPKSLIYYKDSIAINAVNSCSSFRTAYSIKGKGIDSLVKNPVDTSKSIIKCMFSLPDTTAKIGNRNFMLPIYAQNLSSAETKTLHNLRMRLVIDGDIFQPNFTTTNIIENRVWEANQQVLTLFFDSVLISPVKQQIGSIKGTILLSEKDYTLLTFRYISFDSDSSISIIDTTNGKIVTNLNTEVCGKAFRSVGYYKPLTINVAPNPVSDEITIAYNLPVDVPVVASLYSSLGEKVVPLLDTFQKAGEYSFTIPLIDRNLNSGVYYLRVSAGTRSVIEKVIITR